MKLNEITMNRARSGLCVLGMLFAAIVLPGGIRAAEVEATNSRPLFSAFKMVLDRNIFNTRRSARYVPSVAPDATRYTRSESFALVGSMSYDKGLFAFFEGSGAEYQKVLKQDDSIAGFKVTEISPSSVKLVSSTNQFELKVGMQLSRQDGGEWRLGTRPESSDSGSLAANWKAQPAAPRTENSSEGDAPPFPLPPPGAIFDQITQAIQGSNTPGATGGNDQNRQAAVITRVTTSGATNESPDAVLQMLIRRRQQQNQ